MYVNKPLLKLFVKYGYEYLYICGLFSMLSIAQATTALNDGMVTEYSITKVAEGGSGASLR
jgi:hypothetical protein